MYSECTLCERKCRVNRIAGQTGYCKSYATPRVSLASLHFYEEPIISGTRGSGAIFFSGCSLGCIYCQNSKISRAPLGKELDARGLKSAMLELHSKGAHNINLVTPTHFVPTIAEAIDIAREGGLDIPIVYNTSSYESESALRLLDGRVDVYLPDLKYYRQSLAEKYSGVKNYPDTARRNIDIMLKQRGRFIIGEGGLIKSGVVVRLLLLPSALADTKLNLKYLYDNYGDDIYISLMSQYTPIEGLPSPLSRRVTAEEYDELTEYAYKLGVKYAFTQERESASSSYTPDFDTSLANIDN